MADHPKVERRFIALTIYPNRGEVYDRKTEAVIARTDTHDWAEKIADALNAIEPSLYVVPG